MGSHPRTTDTTRTPADKSEQKLERNSTSIPPTATTVCHLDSELRAQLATEASIWIGPYALTFVLAQRIARDLRNSKSSHAIAELKSTSGKLHSGPGLALYDFKL
jgi:hypothetical protein